MPLRGTPTWRFHTDLYIFQSNVSAINSTTECHTDLRLGEVVYVNIFYNITNSWLLSVNGFDFNVLWRDSENWQLVGVFPFFKGQRKPTLVKKTKPRS